MAKFVLEHLNEEIVLEPGEDPVGLGGEPFECSKSRAEELRDAGIRLRPEGERSEAEHGEGPDVVADPATTPPDPDDVGVDQESEAAKRRGTRK